MRSLVAFVLFPSAVLAQGTTQIAPLAITGQTNPFMPSMRFISFVGLSADPEGSEFAVSSNIGGNGAISQSFFFARPNYTQPNASYSPIAQLCNLVPAMPEPTRYGPFSTNVVMRGTQLFARHDFWTCGEGPYQNPAVVFSRTSGLHAREGTMTLVTGLPQAITLGPIGAFAALVSNSIVFFSDYGTAASGVLGRGLFVSTLGGPSRAVAVIGSQIGNATPGTVIAGFDELSLRAEFDGYVLVNLTGGGTSAETDSAIVRISPSGGPPQTVIREGQPAFGIGPGGTFVGEINRLLAVIPGSTALFLTQLRGPGVSFENDTAICSASGGTALIIAREGSSSPGLPAGSVYRAFGTALVTWQPSMILAASLTGEGIDSTNDEMLIHMASPSPGAQVVVIAREGSQVPGLNVNYGSLLGPVPPTLSIGQFATPSQLPFAFKAPLTGDGVDASNDEAWFLGVGATAAAVLRKGDIVTTAPGVTKTVARINFSPQSSGRDGRRAAMTRENSAGAIVIFTDETEGAFAARLSGACPSILQQPTSRIIVRPGRAFSLSVTAAGLPAPALLWYRDGTPLLNDADGMTGVTASVLSCSASLPIHNGLYTVRATNSCGSVVSAAATVIVPCVADYDDGTGNGTPDGGVTIDDLLYYLLLFQTGDALADTDDGSGSGSIDGGVTIEDLLYFLLRYEAGC